MESWLSIISDYDALHVSLCKKDQTIQTLSCNKTESNKYLLSLIKELLNIHHIALYDLSYIGVNTGPGPYTSLRVAITTANALAFSTNIKLMGIDSLVALVKEYSAHNEPVLALLNAFNNEVFYALGNKQAIITSGCASIEYLITAMTPLITPTTTIVGNGAIMFANQIKNSLSNAYLNDKVTYPSITFLNSVCWHTWLHNRECATDELFPLYLKNIVYKNSINVD